MKTEIRKRADGSAVILFKGECIIDSVQEMRTSLAGLLKEEKHVVIDLTETTDIDLSAIQLLLSAYRTAVKKKILFTIKVKNEQAIVKKIGATALFPSPKK